MHCVSAPVSSSLVPSAVESTSPFVLAAESPTSELEVALPLDPEVLLAAPSSETCRVPPHASAAQAKIQQPRVDTPRMALSCHTRTRSETDRYPGRYRLTRVRPLHTRRRKMGGLLCRYFHRVPSRHPPRGPSGDEMAANRRLRAASGILLKKLSRISGLRALRFFSLRADLGAGNRASGFWICVVPKPFFCV